MYKYLQRIVRLFISRYFAFLNTFILLYGKISSLNFSNSERQIFFFDQAIADCRAFILSSVLILKAQDMQLLKIFNGPECLHIKWKFKTIENPVFKSFCYMKNGQLQKVVCARLASGKGVLLKYMDSKAEIVEIDFLYFEKNICLLFTYLS